MPRKRLLRVGLTDSLQNFRAKLFSSLQFAESFLYFGNTMAKVIEALINVGDFVVQLPIGISEVAYLDDYQYAD